MDLCCCTPNNPPEHYFCYTMPVCRPLETPPRKKPSHFVLKNIIDASQVLTKVLKSCDIKEYKLVKALEHILDCFVNYEEYYDDHMNLRKKIRKCDFESKLKKKCHMTKHEVSLVYSFVKYAFHTFYNTIDTLSGQCNCYAVMQWREAVKKTIGCLKRKRIVWSVEEIDAIIYLINLEYGNLIQRMKFRQSQKDETTPCGLCSPIKFMVPCSSPCKDDESVSENDSTYKVPLTVVSNY